MPILRQAERGSRSERVYAALRTIPGANRHALVHETLRLIHKIHNHPWNGRAGNSVGLTINKALDLIADNDAQPIPITDHLDEHEKEEHAIA